MENLQKYIEITVKHPEDKVKSEVEKPIKKGKLTQPFLFVTKDVHTCMESAKIAYVKCTALELDKPSINGRIYAFSEGDEIAESMVDKPVYYDLDWKGKHRLDEEPVGKILVAKRIGKKIKAILGITDLKVIDKLRKGLKFLFSVGGHAKTFKVISTGKRIVEKLYGTVVQHLQMIPDGKNIFGKSKVGFPEAKMEKLIEIRESVLYVGKSIAIMTALGLI